jgi:uncharacterized repeat protein (TIGR03803 family)
MNVSLHSRIHITVRALLIGLAIAAVLCTSSWAASEKVLYRFHGKDGNVPVNVIIGPGGVLYGTTVDGGANSCNSNGCGVVFQLTRSSDGKWQETVLHDFAGSDGMYPNGAIVADKSGNLYGTTVYGGPNGCSGLGCGVAFELEKGRSGRWAFKILHLFFQQQGDGLQPYAGMVFDSKGNLYGTTSGGGNFACTGGCGVVFELSPGGEGNWTETVLYSFQGADGATPMAPLTFDSSGSLYGTTQWGTNAASGTVIKLSPGQNGQWSEEVLHSFSFATKDGDEPISGLVFDGSGNLYSTTQFGGTAGQQGWGTAFRLSPAGGGKWKETILRSFNRYKPGGGFPSGLILDANGNLFGSTGAGGRCNSCGVIFRLTSRAKGKWGETILHSFKGKDGVGPGGDLIFNSAGHLLGVTNIGGYTGGSCGQVGCGVVFDITP